jgi:hypothetical protein
MERRAVRKKKEEGTMRTQKGVFETVFDQTYIPFEKLFEISYQGEYSIHTSVENKPNPQRHAEDK